MPRTAAAHHDVTQHMIDAPTLAPPPGLCREERADWTRLVGAYPGRFGPGDVPLLVELMRHVSIARRVGAEMDALGAKPLGDSDTRALYLQLAGAAREQAKIVAMLSTRLRLVQTRARRPATDAERRASPAGPRPWDERRDN
jgi:hypothetical protein